MCSCLPSRAVCRESSIRPVWQLELGIFAYLHIKVKHNMAIVLQDNSSRVCPTADAGVHAARRAHVPQRVVLNVERAVVDVG